MSIPSTSISPKVFSGDLQSSESQESPSTDGAVMFDVACELQELLGQILTAVGMSKDDQRHAALGNRKVIKGQKDRPSIRVMSKSRGLGTILATWKKDKRYLDENGEPAVLPIAGSGRTLESIARERNITMSLDEIVEKLCEWGDVSRLHGDRVGLLGTSAVIHRNNPLVALAMFASHMRRMVETTLVNLDLPGERRAEGLFQRAITGSVRTSQFVAFAQAVRPRLQEICDELEERISAEGSSVINYDVDDVCGFEIFLFREGYKGRPPRRRLQKFR